MQDESVHVVDGREVVVTASLHVRCDGGEGQLGHPMEYITLERDGEALCQYCGRRFVHAGHAEAGRLRGSQRLS